MSLRMTEEALTFDDVLLLPGHSTALPKDVSLTTQLTSCITLNIPLLSAAMDTVTEASMAVALAEHGGMGIIHKSMSITDQAAEVHKVKKFESGVVVDPVTVTPTTTIGALIDTINTHRISGMPVVEGRQLVGIITNRDIRFETNNNELVQSLMTPKERLITVRKTTGRQKVMALFRFHRVENLLISIAVVELRGIYIV